MSAFASVLLPEPLGPMTAWTSPLFRPRETPLRISRPSTATRRSAISKSAIHFPFQVPRRPAPPRGRRQRLRLLSRSALLRVPRRFDLIRAGAVALPEPRRPSGRGSQQPLVHLPLLLTRKPGAGRHVLDRTVAVADLELAPRPGRQLGHVARLRGHPDQLLCPPP